MFRGGGVTFFVMQDTNSLNYDNGLMNIIKYCKSRF